MAIDLRPNAGTAAEAKKGLAWYEDGKGGDGLVEGTIRDARKMAAREPLSEDKVRRMVAWFARHAPDLESAANSDPENDDYPGPGRVAWSLWGGDAGRTWAERKVSQMDAESQRELSPEEGYENDLLGELAQHLEMARACLDALVNANAMEAEDETEEPDEAPVDAPPAAAGARSVALRVEKRDGATVQLRSSSGALRTVKIPEAREMVAPIALDENEDSEKTAPVFRGHAAVFDVQSEDLGGFTESISRGAFKRALQAGQDTVALFNHNQDYVLGRTTNGTLSLVEDPRGLAAQFEAPDTQYARDIRELVRRQDVNQMSFAFTVARDDWQEREDGSIHRRVLEVDRLYDVSLVTTPAYPQTSASSVRSDLPENSDETLEPPVEGAASAENPDRDPREARLNELQAGAKRRVSVARFRTNHKKEKN